MNKALKAAFKFCNDGFIFSLNYKHEKLTFGCVINATDGCVTGALMKALTANNINGLANESINNERTYVINYLHVFITSQIIVGAW
jgi:hypothetical protein